MAPRARDNDTSCGQSDMMGMRSVPSLTVWVLQPPRPTTWLPTGNAGLLLWITLQKNRRRKRSVVCLSPVLLSHMDAICTQVYLKCVVVSQTTVWCQTMWLMSFMHFGSQESKENTQHVGFKMINLTFFGKFGHRVIHSACLSTKTFPLKQNERLNTQPRTFRQSVFAFQSLWFKDFSN